MAKNIKHINWYRVKIHDLFADNICLAFQSWGDVMVYLSNTIGWRTDIIPELSSLADYLESDAVVKSIRGYHGEAFKNSYYVIEEKQH